MTLNIMGNYQNNRNESDLIANLVEEAIDQRGVVAHYIIRDMVNPDYLLGESPISEFKEYYQIPIFIESMEHFNGNGDMWDAFGMQYTEASIFQVGARRFRVVIGEKEGFHRPREGDLIYLPMTDSLWEINKTKMDLRYYQVGSNHSYRMVCKLFQYSHETIQADTETDFNSILSNEGLDDDNIKKILGVGDKVLTDDTDALEQNYDTFKTIKDKDDCFGF